MNEYDFSERGGFCEACMKIWIIVLTKKKRNEKKRLTNPETYDKLNKSSGNGHEKNMGVFPSGQWGQTVNLLLFSFGGSNPPAPTKNSSVVMTLEFLFYLEVCKAPQGWIRTASAAAIRPGGKKAPAGPF